VLAASVGGKLCSTFERLQDETVVGLDVSLNDIEHLRWVTAFPMLKSLAAFACKLPSALGVDK
jgi:hypothetical protein